MMLTITSPAMPAANTLFCHFCCHADTPRCRRHFRLADYAADACARLRADICSYAYAADAPALIRAAALRR